MEHSTTKTTNLLRAYHKHFVNKAIITGKTLDYILDNLELFCKANHFNHISYTKYVIEKYYKHHNIK